MSRENARASGEAARGRAPRSRVLARLASLAQIGEPARRLYFNGFKRPRFVICILFTPILPTLLCQVMEKSGGFFRMKDIQARDTMGLDEVGKEKNKPSERGAMRWRAGKARRMPITTTVVSCLEDDNKCMVYVSYAIAWARPL